MKQTKRLGSGGVIVGTHTDSCNCDAALRDDDQGV